MSLRPILTDGLKLEIKTTDGPVFVDNEIRALWWIAPIVFVVAGLLTLTRGPLPIWPFLFFWGLSLALVVHVFREPAISVSIGAAEAVGTKRWPKLTRIEKIPLSELGSAVIIEDKYSEDLGTKPPLPFQGGVKLSLLWIQTWRWSARKWNASANR